MYKRIQVPVFDRIGDRILICNNENKISRFEFCLYIEVAKFIIVTQMKYI